MKNAPPTQPQTAQEESDLGNSFLQMLAGFGGVMSGIGGVVGYGASLVAPELLGAATGVVGGGVIGLAVGASYAYAHSGSGAHSSTGPVTADRSGTRSQGTSPERTDVAPAKIPTVDTPTKRVIDIALNCDEKTPPVYIRGGKFPQLSWRYTGLKFDKADAESVTIEIKHDVTPTSEANPDGYPVTIKVTIGDERLSEKYTVNTKPGKLIVIESRKEMAETLTRIERDLKTAGIRDNLDDKIKSSLEQVLDNLNTDIAGRAEPNKTRMTEMATQLTGIESAIRAAQKRFEEKKREQEGLADTLRKKKEEQGRKEEQEKIERVAEIKWAVDELSDLERLVAKLHVKVADIYMKPVPSREKAMERDDTLQECESGIAQARNKHLTATGLTDVLGRTSFASEKDFREALNDVKRKLTPKERKILQERLETLKNALLAQEEKLDSYSKDVDTWKIKTELFEFTGKGKIHADAVADADGELARNDVIGIICGLRGGRTAPETKLRHIHVRGDGSYNVIFDPDGPSILGFVDFHMDSTMSPHQRNQVQIIEARAGGGNFRTATASIKGTEQSLKVA